LATAPKAYARFHALTGDKTNDLSLPVLRELDTAEALRHLGLQRLLLVGVSAVVTGSLNPLGRGVVVLFAVLFLSRPAYLLADTAVGRVS
jgi:hypothetical protein